jgi:hypothetical protein
MKKIFRKKRTFWTFLALAGFIAAISVVSPAQAASLMSDPYSDVCVFDGGQPEQALIQPPLSPQGEFCISIDPDNPVMIGKYIEEKYPEVWKMLTPEDQEYYNSKWAVWPCGAEEPMLPNKVIRLLRSTQSAPSRPTLQEQQVTVPSQPQEPAVPVTALSVRLANGKSRLQEVRSGGSLGVVFDARSLIASKQSFAVRTLPKFPKLAGPL